MSKRKWKPGYCRIHSVIGYIEFGGKNSIFEKAIMIPNGIFCMSGKFFGCYIILFLIILYFDDKCGCLWFERCENMNLYILCSR